jgi:hypothetical protein
LHSRRGRSKYDLFKFKVTQTGLHQRISPGAIRHQARTLLNRHLALAEKWPASISMLSPGYSNKPSHDPVFLTGEGVDWKKITGLN